MFSQYWVGDFFVDLSRNQISLNEHTHTIAPKALAVLTYLAKHPRKVVSQNELLDQIWPDTLVTPNTLQRSIAQLRKTLGDDRKTQSYIKTHAKQGYSLECEVVWSDEKSGTLEAPAQQKRSAAFQPETAQRSNTAKNSTEQEQHKVRQRNLVPLAAIVLLLVLGGLATLFSTPKHSTQLAFHTIQAITSTDNKEFSPAYSADGEFIIFNRYQGRMCANRLWARNIHTEKEVLLTKDWGSYGRHSLSPDGKNLVFISTEDCSKPEEQNVCFDLVNLDFQKALENPQLPKVLLSCQSSVIKKPVWLDNHNIALMQKLSNRWQLIKYSTQNNTSRVLYAPEDRALGIFDFSTSEGLIAITSRHKNNQQYLDLLTPNGKIISSHPVNYPDEIPRNRNIGPNFSPLEKQLIFSTGRQLFTLSYTGQVTKVDLPLDEPMSTPKFHPNGKRALAIKGRYDSDIASLPLNSPAFVNMPTISNITELYPSIARSISGEDDGIYQPKGNLIAFTSARSGEEQVWLSSEQELKKVSRFPMDTFIRGLNWAANGESLLVNANSSLTQVFLDGSEKDYFLPHSVSQLFQWDSEANTALLLLKINGKNTLAEVDLHRLDIQVINNKDVKWAQKTADRQLIYMDQMKRFWRPGAVEDQLIEQLNGQGISQKRFALKDNVIYAINGDDQLWSYNLNTNNFAIMSTMHKDVSYLSDINETNILFTFVVSAKKEVVELYLQE